jgi:hypothetical protein
MLLFVPPAGWSTAAACLVRIKIRQLRTMLTARFRNCRPRYDRPAAGISTDRLQRTAVLTRS